jgi:hypothetical protein
MCTYQTDALQLSGSAKGPGGEWLRLTDATVYVDHPVHALVGHSLNVDLRAPALGPGARVALELPAESARRLAETILHALDTAPAGVLDAD